MANSAIIVELDHYNKKGKITNITNDESRAFKSFKQLTESGSFLTPSMNKVDTVKDEYLEHHLIIIEESLLRDKQFKLMNQPPNKHIYMLAHDLNKIHTIIEDMRKD